MRIGSFIARSGATCARFSRSDDSTRMLLDEWMTDGETARHPNLVDSLEDLLREAHFNRYLQSGAARRESARDSTSLAEDLRSGFAEEGVQSQKQKEAG